MVASSPSSSGLDVSRPMTSQTLMHSSAAVKFGPPDLAKVVSQARKQHRAKKVLLLLNCQIARHRMLHVLLSMPHARGGGSSQLEAVPSYSNSA